MKAIDIALIPVRKQDLQALIALSDKFNAKPFLNATNRMPHVTLGMAVLTDEQIKKWAFELKTWTQEDLVFQSFSSFERPQSEPLIWLNVEKNPSVYQMHQDVMQRLVPGNSTVEPTHFQHASNLKGSEASYVSTYVDYALESFQPHLTVGYGDVRNEPVYLHMPMRAGIFHLGPSCTCAAELS